MPQFLHKDAKDLISKMLIVEPSNRITIPQIKEHPWFRSNNTLITIFLPPVIFQFF